MQAQHRDLEQLLDHVQMTESDRRAAKAQLRQAEALIDVAVRIVTALRSAIELPRRLKPSPRAR